jgi:hypothetical protein
MIGMRNLCPREQLGSWKERICKCLDALKQYGKASFCPGQDLNPGPLLMKKVTTVEVTLFALNSNHCRSYIIGIKL